MQVSRINLIVHPLFAQDSRGANQPDPIEQSLRNMRDLHIASMVGDESAVLLYFASTLNERELNRARRGTLKLTETQALELAKIQEYEKLLGNQIEVIPATP